MHPAPETAPSLSLSDFEAARAVIADRVLRTPVQAWSGPALAAALGPGTRVTLKLELFQATGSFKARSALFRLRQLDADQRSRGVCAISAGNHAIATAWAAREAGTSARVVMLTSSNPFRIAECRRHGAEIELIEDVHEGFRRVREIERDEARTFIHPFEGIDVARGTGTLGLEFIEQAPELEAVIVPIGGGGLAAGVSTAIKLAKPACQVWGVEPFGADTMYRSLETGSPASIEKIETIADSLGAPYASPVSFALCRAHLDGVVRVTDAELVAAMRFLQEHARLAVEPAGAAATAALLGPLRERLAGRRVGLIVCGSNIDAATYARLLGSA